MHLPAALLHMRAVPSVDAVSNAFPSEENSDDTTEPLCPANMSARTPVCTFHRQAVASSEAVARKASSGENCAALTVSPWPRKVCRHSPVSAHHTLAALSLDVPATQAPSDETVHDTTLPLSLQRGAPVSSHHTWASASEDTVRRSLPSGESTVESTGSARFSGAMEAKVLSNEAVQHRNGVCTTERASPSEMPDSAKVEYVSRTCDLKTKCSRMVPWDTSISWSTASCRHATISVGLTLTCAAMLPLTAWYTVSASSFSTSRSSSSSFALSVSRYSLSTPAATALSSTRRTSSSWFTSSHWSSSGSASPQYTKFKSHPITSCTLQGILFAHARQGEVA
mmetsp:Transcript_117874/g.345348  ORF Transcript_117874/g.345348 Transcript_117874/m.345348 type:complete len:339 (+) Transcript_117874:635-1651(+)